MLLGEELQNDAVKKNFLSPEQSCKDPCHKNLYFIAEYTTGDNNVLVVFQTRQMKKPCENALMKRIFQTHRKPRRKPQSSLAFCLSSFVNALHMLLFSRIQR